MSSPQQRRFKGLFLILLLLGALFSWRAYINYRQQKLDTELAKAVAAKNLNAVKRALDKGANPDTLNDIASPNFWQTIKAMFLRPFGAVPSVQNEKIPLVIAATQDDSIDILTALLQAGADTSVRREDGRSALNLALESYNQEAIEAILIYGKNANKNNELKIPVLLWAAQNGFVTVVEFEIKKGGDANMRDQQGNTALILAAVNRHSDVVSSLVEHGADINAQNKEGSTALMLVAEIKDDMKSLANDIEILLLNHADPQIKDKQGNTALRHAWNVRNYMIARYLLQIGVGG